MDLPSVFSGDHRSRRIRWPVLAPIPPGPFVRFRSNADGRGLTVRWNICKILLRLVSIPSKVPALPQLEGRSAMAKFLPTPSLMVSLAHAITADDDNKHHTQL